MPLVDRSYMQAYATTCLRLLSVLTQHIVACQAGPGSVFWYVVSEKTSRYIMWSSSSAKDAPLLKD